MIDADVNWLAQNHMIGYRELMVAINCFSPCMNDYLYVYDIDDDVYSISESAMDRFLLPSSSFSDVFESHKKFVYADDFDMLQKDLKKMTTGEKDSHDLLYRWVGRDGFPIWINCRGIIIRSEHTLMVGCINEIGDRPYADNVTGFLRTDAFRHELKHQSQPNGFMLRIGIDGFKQINERLGSDYGDKCLRELADCIKECLSDKQSAYRLISDEIMVADFCGGTEDEAKDFYERLRNKVDILLRDNKYEAVYTISGGIITQECIDVPIEEISFEWINRRSLFALNYAKELGRNQVYAFRKEDYARFVRKGKILNSVRKSIANNGRGFFLNYQPIMFSGENTGIFAAEMLLRYQDENGENIAPYELIPILEDSGLIIPIGVWQFGEAFRFCKKCRETIPDFKVSINLSYVQFRRSNLYEDIMDVLRKYDLPADAVILEMTESGYLDYASVKKTWNRLVDAGFVIALDDFGTGYSNLHNIVDLHPDIIKIDRSFTIKALCNDYEALLMKYITSMVHSVNVRLVVEGIETQEELEKINTFGVDYIQGYFYSKPVSEAELVEKFIAF